MTNRIAPIALIAYILGGWILPAAHYHSYHAQFDRFGDLAAMHQHGVECGHSHGSQPEDGAQLDDGVQPEDRESIDQDGCDSAFCGDSGCGEAVAKRSASTQYEPATFADCCGGLCALCLARSLSSEFVPFEMANVRSHVASQGVAMASQNVPAGLSPGSVSSRGPPIIL